MLSNSSVRLLTSWLQHVDGKLLFESATRTSTSGCVVSVFVRLGAFCLHLRTFNSQLLLPLTGYMMKLINFICYCTSRTAAPPHWLRAFCPDALSSPSGPGGACCLRSDLRPALWPENLTRPPAPPQPGLGWCDEPESLLCFPWRRTVAPRRTAHFAEQREAKRSALVTSVLFNDSCEHVFTVVTCSTHWSENCLREERDPGPGLSSSAGGVEPTPAFEPERQTCCLEEFTASLSGSGAVPFSHCRNRKVDLD